MEDREIVDLYFKRSESAIEETDKKYGRHCYCIANRILNDEEDAKEIVNDTYLKAWNTIPPNKPTSLYSYLGMLARQLSLNKYKEKTRKKRGGNAVDIAIYELENILASESASDIMDKKHLGSVLNRFLGELPKKSRMIFIRRYWYMDSISTISKTFAISEANVKITLFRLRQRLKKYLKKEGIDV